MIFRNSDDLEFLKQCQENKKIKSDQSEILRKQLESISEEQMEILYNYSIGSIHRDTAMELSKDSTNKTKKEEVVVNSSEMNSLLQFALNKNQSQNNGISTPPNKEYESHFEQSKDSTNK